jgi:hypothetical protein
MVITGYGDSGCNATATILVKNSSNPIGAIISPGNTVNLCLPANELGFAVYIFVRKYIPQCPTSSEPDDNVKFSYMNRRCVPSSFARL